MAFSLTALRQRRKWRRAAKQAQVIGLCRFSYPAYGGFKTLHDTPVERARFLYAPRRLDERFAQFEALTLPALRAQSDADFTFLIVIGEDFPEDRLAQLRALTQDMPQVVIQAHPPRKHREVMKDAVNSVRRPGCFSIQFRNDDDDAMNARFVEKLRQTLRQSYPMFAASRHVAVDFTRGFQVQLDATGMRYQRAKDHLHSTGMGVVFRPDVDLCLMNFTHHEIWQHMPVICRNDPDMWIRGVNGFNDSRDPLGTDLQSLDPAMETRFQTEFGIDPNVAREIARGRQSPAPGRR